MIGLPGEDGGKPILRAYSIASPCWAEELEFVSIKVQDGPLTSRLQKIQPGDTVLMGKKPTGTLVLDALTGGERLFLIGTGTGLAPWLSVARDPDTYARFGHVYVIHTVRSVAAAGHGWRLWPLCDRAPLGSAAQMAQGLVALLGDAAHPMPPYLAQGAGMAIEDAAQLQRALAMHDMDVPLRLRRYALNRWERAGRVQARSQRNGRIFHATGPVRWARDLSLRLLGERLLDVPWLYRGDGSNASAL